MEQTKEMVKKAAPAVKKDQPEKKDRKGVSKQMKLSNNHPVPHHKHPQVVQDGR